MRASAKRIRPVWGVVCLFFVLVAGCGRQQEPIKIGLAINLSGRGGAAAEYIRAGALMAVEDVNARGGVRGRPLQLLIEDDQDTEQGVLAADARLVQAGVIAIIGHSYSQNTLTAYPFVTSRHTLLFTPYTATTKLTDLDDLFCRTAVDNRLYGRALAALLQKQEINRAAFLLDMANPAFTEDYLEHTVRYYPGRVTAVRFNSKEEVD